MKRITFLTLKRAFMCILHGVIDNDNKYHLRKAIGINKGRLE